MKKFALIMAISLTLGSAARCEAQSLMSGLLDGLMKRPRTIETTGSAVVNVVPDEVLLQVGVQTFNSQLPAASSENNDRTKDLIDLGKKYGISAEDIQTSSLTIEPVHKNDREDSKITGYRVRKDISFDLKDLSKMELLLAEAIKNGASTIGNMEFKTTKLRKYKDQARVEAAKAAREKAVALAQALGAELGKVQKIKEIPMSDIGYQRPYASNINLNVATSPEIPPDDTANSGSFAAGKMTVQASVEVTWELE
ncbi:MAG: SIMPL domain-containing protein [Cyanobacteria bacterium SZAS TMP-1]|nr:SIMPL domain-containing protein [Cyanobacteria bacterium SZAS TMP-1]